MSNQFNRTLREREQKSLDKHRTVKCMRHGPGPGFVACLHVLDGKAPVGFMEEPGKSHPTIGMLLCRDCTAVGGGAKPYLRQSDMGLVCGQCARDRGINRLGGKLVSPEGADSLPEPSDKASPEFAAWKQRNPWKYWEDIEDAPAN